MPLATFEDANQWLDLTKIRFLNAADAAGDADNADNMVRGRLGGVYPDHVSLWDAVPTGPQITTPAIVREAASLLMAAYLYSRKYSEEVLGENDFSARLERRSMAIMDGLRDGTFTLDDVDYDVGITIGQPDFWPNDSYVDPVTLLPVRFFTVEDRY